MVFKKQKKVPIEQLQEEHLTGPANLPLDEVAKEMQVDQVVAVREISPMETIVFRNQRDPGQPLEFHFSSATCPFKMYTLIDGHKYTLPVEVIRNLERCRENIEKYRKNADGIPQVYVAGYKSHFLCERA
jgi:hypothetical protein